MNKEDLEKVDHPSHYNREGAMECINEMLLIFGKENVKAFCLLNAIVTAPLEPAGRFL